MLCDSNINTQKLYSTENKKTSTERALKPIFSSLIDNILNQGVAIMPTGYTRQNHKGHLKTIDQIMTTHPQKLNNTRTLDNMYSDHKMITTTRLTKEPTYTPRYFQTRCYKDVSTNPLIFNEIETFLMTHPKISEAESESRPDECATLIQEAVTEALQTYIPLKTVQTNKQKPTFATKETRDIIDARDQAYKKYKITQNPEDKRNYSNLRNLVTKNLNQEQKGQRYIRYGESTQ